MQSTPFTDPETFFRDRPDPSLLAPTVIVLGYGVVPLLVAVAYTVYDEATGGVGFGVLSTVGAERDVLWFGVALLLVGPLIAWWVDAAIMYLVSTGGSGSYDRLLAYVGWGHLPLLLALIAWFAVSAVLELVGLPGLSTVAGGAVMVAGALWTGYIWVVAVTVARNVSVPRALLAVLVPLATYLWIALPI